MSDEGGFDVPVGMVDVSGAISVLHVVSEMVGNQKNRSGVDVLSRLRKLGFSDETSFYLLWYVICVLYHEIEEISSESFNMLVSLGGEINDVLDNSDIYPSLSEGFRTLIFMEDQEYFGEMKHSWKDHWKARYMKYWRRYLDSQDSSVPYFKGEGYAENVD